MMVRVDEDTLYVEFCCGYAGVMIGIRWYLSDGFTWVYNNRRFSDVVANLFRAVLFMYAKKTLL